MAKPQPRLFAWEFSHHPLYQKLLIPTRQLARTSTTLSRVPAGSLFLVQGWPLTRVAIYFCGQAPDECRPSLKNWAGGPDLRIVSMRYSPLGHFGLTLFVSNKRRFHSGLTSQPKGPEFIWTSSRFTLTERGDRRFSAMDRRMPRPAVAKVSEALLALNI